MNKAWIALDQGSIAALPAQLGVYEIADQAKSIVKIGFAGGKEPFGIRTALERELALGGAFFRHEFTHGYMTRWQELLMAYQAVHDGLPVDNYKDAVALGRLSPGTSS